VNTQTKRWIACSALLAVSQLVACGGDDTWSPASPCGGAAGMAGVALAGNNNMGGNSTNMGGSDINVGGNGMSGGSMGGGGAGAIDAGTDSKAGAAGTSQADASDANAGQDAARDASSEGANDAPADAGSDAHPDASSDASPDAVADAATDATSEANADGGDGGPITTASLLKAKAANCYQCAVDYCPDNLASLDCETLVGNAAAGPAAGQSKTSLCLALLSCELTNNCGGGVKGASACYCGTSGLSCFTTGGNGACLADEQKGLETTDPGAILGAFSSTTLGGGRANGLVQCLNDNIATDDHCASCFP